MSKSGIPIDILLKYQQDDQLTRCEQRTFSKFVDTTVTSTWCSHFKRKRKDWLIPAEILESVPLAFMEYMKYRKNVKCLTSYMGSKAYYCDLSIPPVYHAPVVSYTVWKRQFPRVLTALTAQYCGVSLLEPADRGYYPMPVLVELPQMKELHEASVLLRGLYAQHGLELYSVKANDYLHEVAQMMIRSTTSQRVAARRMMAINAAVSMLQVRIIASEQYTKQREARYYV